MTGSRRPLLGIVAAIGAVLLASLPATRSIAALLTVWCGAQVGVNGVFVLITAALVDWFPAQQRGRASAVAATGQVIGALIASGLRIRPRRPHRGGCRRGRRAPAGGRAARRAPRAWPAVTSRACPGPPLVPVTTTSRPPGNYRDARLAWVVRAVVTFANTLVFTFANYYVSDVLHLRDPQRFVGLAAGVTAVLVLAGALTSGRASDRSQRRRRYVISAVMIMAGGELLLAWWQTAPGVLTACALFGFGYGVYLSVDQALTADVLPDPQVYGRDIGVMNAAISAPQIAAPALAAALLGASASYHLLFAAGALITVTGAAFVLPIRRVS